MITALEYKPFVLNTPLKSTIRVQSIDILRGIVMLLMALDHVRHFLHTPAMIDEPTNLATTTPVLFFTRWITHFCAPVFIFLSGISAYISGQKKTKAELSAFLIKRGFWLICIEAGVITFSWSFNPWYNTFFLQVIWAIGCSMIILGLLVRTSLTVITAVAFLILFGHNILDYLPLAQDGPAGVLWNIFFTSSIKFYTAGNDKTIAVLYAILPWTAVMLLGYAFGCLYRKTYNEKKRRKILLFSGIAFTALFAVLRLLNQYGDPAPWLHQKDNTYTLLSFINVTKYPVSLQYTCMTLGPALIVLALTEKLKNKFTGVLTMYGSVSFFYYVLYFFLIHLLCVLLFFATGYNWRDAIEPGSPFFFRPQQHFGVDLWVVYLVWLFVIAALYQPGKWFARYKKAHHLKWWVSYL